jgi:hypothetical protein
MTAAGGQVDVVVADRDVGDDLQSGTARAALVDPVTQ